MESLGIQAIVLIFYLILINIITFIVYGVDKKRARRKQWRVPEKVLFLLAIIGGSVGALLGMLVFRHKTQKWYFKFGIPAILRLQIAAALVVWKFFLS